VLFEMLTGRRAFKSATAADTLSAILRADPTEALEAGSTVRPGLLRVLRRCLEKSPEDRFQTARDLAFALESATTEWSRSTAADTEAVRPVRSGRAWAGSFDGFTLHAATRAGALDPAGREALLRATCCALRWPRSGWSSVLTAWCASP
jgi:hypothetical protein